MRKAIITLAIAAGLVATACSSQQQGYNAICVDPITQIRMPDVNCNPAWFYYVPYGTFVPAYGVHITHYNTQYTRRPSRGTIRTGGIPATGGKASSGKVSLKKPSSPKGNSPQVKSRSGFRSTFRSGGRK